ncbi:ABC transporter [Penicillium herquei]|nr:ABC transporter [Penicillium herquei]
MLVTALVLHLSRWRPPLIRKFLRLISISKQKKPSSFEGARVDGGNSTNWDRNGTGQQFLANRFLLGTEGVEISYENISMRPRNSENMILFEQSGRIQPASFLGVMGFSGSGKSTLMNIISGRARPTTGHVFLNGRVAKPAQDLIGFVPQDDILLSDLTVRENIMHSARIRLGGVWSKQEIEEYVGSLIISLGLAHVQNQLVGSPDNRRISGGERKRVNVGLELAAAPSMLILDEPTSGLDTTTALSLIVSLKELSQRGMAIICVVHQPRVEIFEAFDQLMVLDSGKQVYLDKAAEAYQRIAGGEKDLSLSRNYNPADMIMDLLSTTGSLQVFNTTTSLESLPHESDVSANAAASIDGIKRQRAPWHVQVWLNFSRGMLQQTRHPVAFSLEMLSSAIIGLLIGLSNYEFKGHLFQGLYKSPFERLSSATSYRLLGEQGMLCCLALACPAGPAGVQTFGNEKLVFFREAYSGHSRSAYFIGKVLSTLFRITLSALHFTTFYMVLTVPSITFQAQLTIDILYYYCIYGLGCFIAGVASSQNAPLVAMLISLIISAIGGCAPRLASVKTWNMEWFWYIWPGLWYSEAVFSESTAPQSHIYSLAPAAQETGYTFGRTNFDFGSNNAIYLSIYRDELQV